MLKSVVICALKPPLRGPQDRSRRRGEQQLKDRKVNSLVNDPAIGSLLSRLHTLSDEQQAQIDAYYAAGADRPTGFETEDSPTRRFWADKFVALDRDKARLVYALCRASRVSTVVEAGTSFGVSTLYLAAAVRDNGGGCVITCENEHAKAEHARRHFRQAGLSDIIEIRVGDVRESLANLEHQIDALLLDIWAPIAGDVLSLVGPRLRSGGFAIADNTIARRDLYEDLFRYLMDESNGFITQTLPFDGGLEFAVKM